MAQAEFDSVADAYDQTLPTHINEYYARKRLDFVRSLVAKGLVLDVGCGTGTLLFHLRQAGYSTIGNEPSLAMLGQAAKRGLADGVTCGVGQALPYANDTFDLTVCVAVLHHIFDPEMVAATVREMTRVTKKGGYAVIWDHNPRNPYWSSLMARMPQDAGKVRLVSAGEILTAIDPGQVQGISLCQLSWTPEFMPAALLPVWRGIEWVMERMPLLKRYAAHNVVILRK